ncbi:carbon-nitrogen family hydrolase [Sporomusa aerivorans]|uniref:carbon-nitrogen family hydrolase n=1 Tax=Sporomusa aerivorans TaxID=204936 RepID=UPI00352BA801
MKIAMLQMQVVAGDAEGNQAKGFAFIQEAARQADTVILPEIWTIGYALKNVSLVAEPINGPLVTRLAGIARDYCVNIIAGSLPLNIGNQIYNSSLVFNKQGSVVAAYNKIHLFSMYGEERFFSAGSSLELFTLETIPAGLGICYDLRFPELFRSLALSGAQITFVPAEWPAVRGDHWRTLVQARAIENSMYLCAVNCVGEHKGAAFYGHSLLVDPEGRIIAEGGSEEAVIYGEIDPDRVNQTRQAMSVFRDRRPDVYKESSV